MSDAASKLSGSSPSAIHAIGRVRREPRRRVLTVSAVEDVTPHMRRVTLTSSDLGDFESQGFDDHVKLFLPSDDGEAGRGPGGAVMRDYTPRRYDRSAGTLTLDFFVHDAGPATAWAKIAAVGSTLTIGGPRGSAVYPDDFDWWLFLGDETALPAIGRRLEELAAGTPVYTVVVLDDLGDAQSIDTACAWTARWPLRAAAGGDEAAAIRDALGQITLPPGDGFIWIAAEAQMAKALRAHVLDTLGHPAAWVKAAGYWVRGRPGEMERLGGAPVE